MRRSSGGLLHPQIKLQLPEGRKSLPANNEAFRAWCLHPLKSDLANTREVLHCIKRLQAKHFDSACRCLVRERLRAQHVRQMMLGSPDSTVDVCRHGTDPGTAGRALNEGVPGAQRTGQPMKLGSNKFDIPTVRPLPLFWAPQQCLNGHVEVVCRSQPWSSPSELWLWTPSLTA